MAICLGKTIIDCFLFPVKILEVKILIYDNVKRLCEKNKTSIWALEKACGIGNGTIGKWAGREAAPSISVLQKIANQFGITVDELLKDNGE